MSFEISYDLRKIYGWMSRISLSRPTLPVTTTHENEKTVECCGSTDVTTACEIVQADETSIQSDGLRAGTADFFDVTKSKELSFTKCLEFFRDKSAFVNHHATIISSGCIDEQHKYETYIDESSDNKVDGYGKLETEGEPTIKIHSQKVNYKNYFHGKQEHAASGALAGVFVSLCLHPVDTIKTVFQSCRADQKSVFSIGQSIISERGLMGLYRGIASNIATAAPISAIYTFTYETVKGSLLPLLPKEYHSFAHCTAGGCASIATSFIFTPSERIKQQMQVSSHYQNCWSAIVKIIGGGGLPSLYAGWGAVLCRNIPHSIIKFYTYESVKQLILSSQHPNTQPNTVQTLLCGGLAGSTAALFSTPFDVVKTRLQTQVPGSASRYHSVISALREISTQEGFKGLYRGLTPRLVMYMSQGALFFSSYEFFKSLFSLETLHQSSQITDYERETDDISMILSLLSS
ncbi:hypothetical protein Nepgr_031586 [Nepenthes gracilis]|uniref:Uncharacterized protein n=1 Tax=Nepenthes gracilis TaxID=150966 RepID=A0AAD3Y594_NEPGR|nr:hypothetical protein Nepgr_031586 [Nepenthes gracilis]